MTGRFEQLVLPGSELEAIPKEDRQSPVVVRVVRTYPHGSAFRYDLEYYALEPGNFDLKHLLRRKDGSATTDVPAIPIKVTPLLPPGQVEPHALEIRRTPFLGGYRLLQFGLGLGWLLGLIAIVYFGFVRSRHRTRPTVAAKPATLADRLRPLIDGAIGAQLDPTRLAELERTLIAFWRKRLQLERAEPAHAIAELRRHAEAGPLLEQLEIWLHRPGTSAPVDLAELLRPYRDLPADALERGWTMSFRHPLVLFALVIPTALLMWAWASRWATVGSRTHLPFDHGRRGGGWGWWLLLSFAESLPPLLLGLIVFILAGPQKYGAPEAKRRMTNIQFCVDVSGSMTAPFGEGNRYDGSMKAIDKFLDYRKGDSFGLTFFGNNYIHWCPLTTDPSAIRCSLPFMRPEVAPPWFGGTNIGKALQGCKKLLAEREEGDKMILLITDGFDSDMETLGPELAKEMKAENITVFCVVAGFHQIQDGIIAVTRGTGGDAFTVDDPEALKVVFQRIDQMKQAKIEKTIAEPMDNYRPYAIAALIVLFLAAACLFGLRYNPW